MISNATGYKALIATARNQLRKGTLKILNPGQDIIQVVGPDFLGITTPYNVHLSAGTCSCNKWGRNMFPCKHAIAAAVSVHGGTSERFMEFMERHSHDVYKVSNLRKIFE